MDARSRGRARFASPGPGPLAAGFGLLAGAARILDRFLITTAALVLFLMMAVMVADVCGRYLFNHPLTWVYDLISLYLMAALFFFSLSDTLRTDRHVAIDLFRRAMPPRFQAFADVVIVLAAIVFFWLVFERGWLRAEEAWVSGDRLVGAVAWPTWIYYFLVPAGAGAILLRLGLRLCAHLSTLLGHAETARLLAERGGGGKAGAEQA